MDLSGPQQIDPNQLISQQARANRIGTTGPYGETRYIEDRGGRKNDSRLVTTLSAPQQALLDEQQRAQLLGLQSAVGRLGSFGADSEASRGRIEQAYMDRAMGLLGPQFEKYERAMQQRLANQGLSQAGGAYNREYGRFETGRNQALGQVANEAILQGGGEESRMLSMIMALLGQGQVQMPEAIAPGPVDVMSPYAMNNQVAQQNRQFGSEILGGLIGAGGQGAATYFGMPAASAGRVPYSYGR